MQLGLYHNRLIPLRIRYHPGVVLQVLDADVGREPGANTELTSASDAHWGTTGVLEGASSRHNNKVEALPTQLTDPASQDQSTHGPGQYTPQRSQHESTTGPGTGSEIGTGVAASLMASIGPASTRSDSGTSVEPRSSYSTKTLLASAFREAQLAVQMDGACNTTRAIESYSKAIALLSRVIDDMTIEEERERLTMIVRWMGD